MLVYRFPCLEMIATSLFHLPIPQRSLVVSFKTVGRRRRRRYRSAPLDAAVSAIFRPPTHASVVSMFLVA